MTREEVAEAMDAITGLKHRKHYRTIAALCRMQHEALEAFKTHLELKTVETLIWAEEAMQECLALMPTEGESDDTTTR